MNSTDFDFDLFFSLDNDLCCPFHQYNNLSSRLHLPFLSQFIHIATAGGLVDEHIYERKIHFQIRKKIKLLHDDMKMGYELNPKLDKILEQKKRLNDENYTFDEELYLHDFIEYAKCGFLSFDRTKLNDINDNNYHLVAYPIFNENHTKIIKELFDVNLKYYDHTFLNKYMLEFVKYDLNAFLYGEGLVLKGGEKSLIALSV